MRIALNSATYFGKASGYQTSVEDWSRAERSVIENASLREFDHLCADVRRSGFRHMELWMGHAFPKFMTPDLALELRQIWERHGLTVVGYSCSLGDPVRFPRWTRLCFETCQMLGIEQIASGISKEAAPVIYAYCREYGIRVAIENHPERHPDEILAIIGDYGDWLGTCVDTGWYASQGFHAPEAIRRLKDHLFHLHFKDVLSEGAHVCTRLGTGVADIAGCIEAVRELGYDGSLSIEQESGDHDPTDDCRQALCWLRAEFPNAL
ncbi:MAG: sugar phosphate isomerase/epimerase [Alicyclobacillus sp.]|nr:sugar phosphate isomerase/epimerase [Alicyclobacillus sp.]